MIIFCLKIALTVGQWRKLPGFGCGVEIPRSKIPDSSFGNMNIPLQVAAAALLEHLGKALGDQQRGVDEAVDAVAQTRLGGVVQLGARLTDALLPADLVELVYLGGMASV